MYIPDTSTQAGPSKGGACPKPTGRPQKKAESGKLVLTYLDECGFAPSQPVTYSWVLPGERKLIPYENPRSRRLNAMAALDRTGPEPGLYWVAKPNKA